MSKQLLILLIVASTGAAAECPGTGFVGIRDFTTRVLGAKSQKAIGLNGYYRMEVHLDSACRPLVNLAKLGYGKVYFPREKVQFRSFPARVYEVEGGDGAEAMGFDVNLASGEGGPLSARFTIVRSGESTSDSGVGFWRYQGDSWESAGMWGGLQWTTAVRNGPYVAPKKPACEARIGGTGTNTVIAFGCHGFVAATGALDRAIYALPALSYGAAFSFDKIATVAWDGRAVAFELCGHSESDNGNPSPWMVTRVLVAQDKPWEDENISPGATKACRVK